MHKKIGLFLLLGVATIGSWTFAQTTSSPVATDPKCFTFDPATKTITKYFRYYTDTNGQEVSCPLDVVIPETIHGVSVEVLGDGRRPVFFSAGGTSTNVTLTVPSSVKKISDNAFKGGRMGKMSFPSITSLILSEGLEEIGKSAFEGNAFADLEIPATVKTIGESAFARNPQLSNVVFHDGLEVIGYSAFNAGGRRCENMPSNSSLNPGDIGNKQLLPDGRTKIYGVRGAIKHVDLPATLQKVGGMAFGCQSLEGELVIPGSLKEIDPGAFRSNKLTKVVFEEGVEFIGAASFHMAFDLDGDNEIVLPASLKKIGNGAFSENNIKKLKLPAGLEEVRDGAFFKNPLQFLSIPESIKLIGPSAFSGNQLDDESVDFDYKKFITPDDAGNYAISSASTLFNWPTYLPGTSYSAFHCNGIQFYSKAEYNQRLANPDCPVAENTLASIGLRDAKQMIPRFDQLKGTGGLKTTLAQKDGEISLQLINKPIGDLAKPLSYRYKLSCPNENPAIEEFGTLNLFNQAEKNLTGNFVPFASKSTVCELEVDAYYDFNWTVDGLEDQKGIHVAGPAKMKIPMLATSMIEADGSPITPAKVSPVFEVLTGKAGSQVYAQSGALTVELQNTTFDKLDKEVSFQYVLKCPDEQPAVNETGKLTLENIQKAGKVLTGTFPAFSERKTACSLEVSAWYDFPFDGKDEPVLAIGPTEMKIPAGLITPAESTKKPSIGYSGGGGMRRPMFPQQTEKKSDSSSSDLKLTEVPSSLFNESIGTQCFAPRDLATIDQGILVSDLFKKAHQMLYSYDLTMWQGTKDYRPFDYLTRQEAAKFMVEFAKKVLCRKPSYTYTHQFNDIENANPSLIPYIKQSYEYVIFKGDGNVDLTKDSTTFRPFDTITRDELAATMVRLVTNRIFDAKGHTNWAAPYTNFLTTHVNTPLSTTKRGVVAESIYDLYKLNAYELTDMGYIMKE